MIHYWTAHSIAGICGVHPGTVRQWRDRKDFPDPDAKMGAAYGWLPETIRAWAAAHRPDLSEHLDHATV